MTDRFKNRLNSTTSVESINRNINRNINFVTDYKELPYNEISEIVNAYDVFSEERNSSDEYRIFGTLRLLASNPLMDLYFQDSDSLHILNSSLFRNSDIIIDDEDGIITFRESYDYHLKELDGWFGYYDPDLSKAAKCSYIDFSPKRTAFEVVHSGDTNWYFYVTYPSSIDTGHTLVNEGLMIVDTGTATIGSIDKMVLTTPVKHNLEAGDIVRLSNTNGYDADYSVLRVGLDNGELREHAFVIDLSATSFTVSYSPTPSDNVRMKRLYLGVESQYYFRKFSAITETNDYEVYNVAYSRNIYGDKVSQVVFNGGTGNDVDLQIGDLKDNLGRPISELYITAVKGLPYGTKTFSTVKSGVEMPFIDNVSNFIGVPDIHRIHNVGTHTTLSHDEIESNVTFNNTEFYGDVVEYNSRYLKEIVLGEVHHRFNTVNRDTTTYATTDVESNFLMGPRPEGYYFKPHHKLEVRRFSGYIEFGDTRIDVNIPDYATNTDGNRYIWRDFLPLGFNDGSYEDALDYPFLNGVHYIHSDVMLNIMRQDPFNKYNLYYGKPPRDPFGDTPDIDNLNGNIGDNVC